MSFNAIKKKEERNEANIFQTNFSIFSDHFNVKCFDKGEITNYLPIGYSKRDAIALNVEVTASPTFLAVKASCRGSDSVSIKEWDKIVTLCRTKRINCYSLYI